MNIINKYFTLFILSIFFTAIPVFAQQVPAEIPFQIIHPPENSHIPAVKSSFVYGSANPSGKLIINGTDVPVHPGGGFIAMVDYKPGKFVITAELTTDTTPQIISRTIYVADNDSGTNTDKLSIGYIAPEQDVEIVQGDTFRISVYATPGKSGYFKIEGIHDKLPLTESFVSQGYYQGVYTIQPGDKFVKSRIRVFLTDVKSEKKISKYSSGLISTISNTIPVIGEIFVSSSILRTGSMLSKDDKAGYLLFPSSGTRLRIIGKKGNEYKIRLNLQRDVWVDKSSIRILPPGISAVPAAAGSIAVLEKPRSVEIRIPLGYRIPFEILASIDSDWIRVNLFGAYSNTDWVDYRCSTRIVNNVQWLQEQTDVYSLLINTQRKSWWGYDIRYEGNVFVLELRAPPVISNDRNLPLSGAVIAVDAGHSTDTGALGPTGTEERNINLEITKSVEQRLKEYGAEVVLTRKGDEQGPVGLYERRETAQNLGADILVSIHCNALPEGQNPFEKNGYGIYYFHPHSVTLARMLHQSFTESFNIDKGNGIILNDDGMHYGDLALTRPPQFPSVLIECAYLMIPREEALLKTKSFQDELAQAIAAGIKRYVLSFK